MKKHNVEYSKKSKDIETEASWRNDHSIKIKNEKKSISKHLGAGKTRTHCLLCGEFINDTPSFNHRGVDYVNCTKCEHIQTKYYEPDGYPYKQMSAGFEKVYPELDPIKFKDRTKRIYKPKLDWVMRNLKKNGHSLASLKQKSWLEIGCGSGHFLQAMAEQGILSMQGLDTNQVLVDHANKILNQPLASVSNNLFEDINEYDPDIILAFFVIEHFQKPYLFWEALKELKPGTIFVFSVPTFGVAAYLESVFDNLPARNFDNVVHTQLYTDGSINYILGKTKFEILSEWVFGQDSQDLIANLSMQYSKYENIPFLQKMNRKLYTLVDPLQEIIDINHLSDARHIIAVKN